METDGVLRFTPRGGSNVAVVPYDDLGAVEGTSNDNPLRVTEKVEPKNWNSPADRSDTLRSRPRLSEQHPERRAQQQCCHDQGSTDGGTVHRLIGR